MSESLEKQLRAALLILEVIEEYHNKELTFTQSCDLMGTIEQFDLDIADELIAAAKA
jgi:hypothetical protein